MEYIRVKWIQNNDNDPVLLYSELNDDRYETRKVEIFRDGRKGYASESEETETTMLGIEPVPPLSLIAEDAQFEPEEVTQEEFERVWSERKKA